MIKGIQKTSLIDYPGKLVSTIFLGGCNFRCHYCHNPELVLPELVSNAADLTEEDFLEIMEKHKKYVDGVCITGGEPTLYPQLPALIRKIKNLGLLVKLDTNGTNPEMLKDLIDSRLIDFIAMDIKAPIEKYELVVNTTLRKDAIIESVEIIRQSNLPYEFRTTVVKEFINKEDIIKIGEWLSGSKRYVLQQFNFDAKVLNEEYKKSCPYTPEELESMSNSIKEFFDEVLIRGI
ncbi:anaerobic ribonucleoside-triphosphate reductase activating protein [Candidatus Woesearchaeota archaeon]|jgi:pyruvate formate lyase activating enzyme|nr:anaerobic ribonucleoside-triphosphate reductase activating protein [Candidatus Woesearchaeota archaeon]